MSKKISFGQGSLFMNRLIKGGLHPEAVQQITRDKGWQHRAQEVTTFCNRSYRHAIINEQERDILEMLGSHRVLLADDACRAWDVDRPELRPIPFGKNLLQALWQEGEKYGSCYYLVYHLGLSIMDQAAFHFQRSGSAGLNFLGKHSPQQILEAGNNYFQLDDFGILNRVIPRGYYLIDIPSDYTRDRDRAEQDDSISRFVTNNIRTPDSLVSEIIWSLLASRRLNLLGRKRHWGNISVESGKSFLTVHLDEFNRIRFFDQDANRGHEDIIAVTHRPSF